MAFEKSFGSMCDTQEWGQQGYYSTCKQWIGKYLQKQPHNFSVHIKLYYFNNNNNFNNINNNIIIPWFYYPSNKYYNHHLQNSIWCCVVMAGHMTWQGFREVCVPSFILILQHTQCLNIRNATFILYICYSNDWCHILILNCAAGVEGVLPEGT